jgi:hypothetical protein
MKIPKMLEEYDFSDGVRGKYVYRLTSAQNTGKTEPRAQHEIPQKKS